MLEIKESQNKPILGITGNYEKKTKRYSIGIQYIKAIKEAGGIPFLLTPSEEIPSFIDGIIMSGGGDVDPLLFGEEPYANMHSTDIDPLRDQFELSLCRYAFQKKLPMLGICRGMQVINVADGGTVFQDIYSQNEHLLEHSQQASNTHKIHKVTCKEDSQLFGIFKETTFLVNSLHHQAVSTLGANMVATAKSSDGIIEAIEHTTLPFVLGVQWHPEWLSDHFVLFESLISQCNANKIN
ncbi:MAG: gamma-glutamyl-gamma-aminobutyrate hydrolase family protein [Bacillota bacterium]